MKTTKRLAAILLALAMVFTLSISAFAAEDSYTITINNETSGHTYGAYQIFDGTISGDVLVDIEWGSAITDSVALLTAIKGGTYTTLDFSTCAQANDVAVALMAEGVSADDVTEFAKAVGNYLTTNNVAATATSTYNTTNYTIAVETGYYLVKDDEVVTGHDSATLYMLDVAANVSMTPKKDVPTVEKKVLEDTDVTDSSALDVDFNDVADWDIGETKQFRLYGTIPADYEELKSFETYQFIFHDTYSDGITVESPVNYTVSYRVGGVEKDLDANTFTATQETGKLTFTCADLKAVLGDDIYNNPTVVITYDAMLNENAKIELEGNKNDVYLEFSNDAYSTGTGETEKDTVIVFTYKLDANKVDSETQDALANAEFILKNVDGKFAVVKDDKFVKWTDVEAEATTLVSDTEGNFSVIGLDADTYYLKETKAPEGYNMLKNEIELTITSDKAGNAIYTQDWNTTVASDAITNIDLTVDGTVDEDNSLTIENSKGVELPETGGVGTTLFYIIGGVLVVAALVVLVAKKRMSFQG